MKALRPIARGAGVLLVLLAPGGLTLLAGVSLYYWTKRRLRRSSTLPSMASSELRRRLTGRPRPRPTRYEN